MALTDTKIEYLDFCWNFYPGCLHSEQGLCPMKRCWARGMSRFKDPSFTPHLTPEKLLEPLERKKPARIGVNFMGDLFGDWVNPEDKVIIQQNGDSHSASLKEWVFWTIKQCPQHTFVFLTKNPSGLAKWSPFPANAWVGVSACDATMTYDALSDAGISWVIIGQQTPARTKTAPDVEWISEIVEAADTAAIPVYLKDNLKILLPINPLFRKKDTPDWATSWDLRQEFPTSPAIPRKDFLKLPLEVRRRILKIQAEKVTREHPDYGSEVVV